MTSMPSSRFSNRSLWFWCVICVILFLVPALWAFPARHLLNNLNQSEVTTHKEQVERVEPEKGTFDVFDIAGTPKYYDQYKPPETKETDDGPGYGIHLVSWKWNYIETPFIYTTLVIVAGLCKLGYHHMNLGTYLPESCSLILLGLIVGLITYYTQSLVLIPHFTTTAFFLYLIPPIVLESAYSLHDNLFFSNLGTILLYAVVGTLVNAFAIGLTLYIVSYSGGMGDLKNIPITEFVVFSTVISAVDPVAVLAIFEDIRVKKELYFLVFGESLLNDAVTIVLYTMMTGFVSIGHFDTNQVLLGVASFFTVSGGGLLIGIILGCVTALITKKTTDVRVVEPLAVLGLAYLSYLVAEMFHFSGIISIIACGIVQAEYCWSNISRKSYTTVKYFTKMLSAICDTIIFIFLGMVLVNDEHEWNTYFVVWAVFLSLLYRFLSVFSLTFLANHFERVRTINLEEQFIMAYGGLRGGVAFSLAIMLDEKLIRNKNLFVTTALFIILFTVFIQGSTVRPLVRLLKIGTQVKLENSLIITLNNKVIDHIMEGIEEVTGYHRGHYWKQVFSRINDKYLKTWLQVEDMSQFSRVFTKVVLAEHFAHLYGKPGGGVEEEILDPNRMKSVQAHDDDSSVGEETVPLKPKDALTFKDGESESFLQVDGSKRQKSIKQRPKRRYTEGSISFIPLRRSMKQATTKSGDSDFDNISKALAKAMAANPYNKYHQKYNKNLVDDDNQELTSLLRARRRRARRLTCTDIDLDFFAITGDVSSKDPDSVSADGAIGRESRRQSLIRNLSGRKKLKKSNTLPASEEHAGIIFSAEQPNERGSATRDDIALTDFPYSESDRRNQQIGRSASFDVSQTNLQREQEEQESSSTFRRQRERDEKRVTLNIPRDNTLKPK